MECMDDCWICEKKKGKKGCSVKNGCEHVFDGDDCEMKGVCVPKRTYCPYAGKGQLSLFERDVVDV